MRLILLTATLALGIPSAEAMAACECTCVDGEPQAFCTSTLDVPPVCPPRVCPILPPSIRPITPPRLPPLGTTSCAPRQVYDPSTQRYEWREICR